MAMMTSRIDDPHALLNALMREDFCFFARKAIPMLIGGKAVKWNWHIDAIAYELDRAAKRQCLQALFTMPPRNLKTLLITIAWVAWMLGRDPTLNFVCVSHSQGLSTKFGRQGLQIMQSSWYRELFPGTKISRSRHAAYDFETTRGGGRLATSITGTLTGRGGDIIIIDDPIKPEDAQSEVARTNVNDWYKSTLASRHNDKNIGVTIVVMQRLHEFDLAGMLLEQGGWQHLSLPAIATGDQIIPLPRGKAHHRRVGDILHPEHEGAEVLATQLARMGSSAFEAQYQQQPMPALGNMIKAAWVKTYEAGFVPTRPGQIVLSFDTASKDGIDNDWTVCIVAHVRHREVRILHVMRERLTFPDLKRRTIELAQLWKADVLLIEDAASGQQLIQTLRNEEPKGVPLPIARRPEGDKYSRMAGVSAQIEAGMLLLPEDAGWLGTFKNEILAFPNSKYDDQADALAQLMDWAGRAYGTPPCGIPDYGAELIEIGGNSSYDYDEYDDPWLP